MGKRTTTPVLSARLGPPLASCHSLGVWFSSVKHVSPRPTSRHRAAVNNNNNNTGTHGRDHGKPRALLQRPAAHLGARLHMQTQPLPLSPLPLVNALPTPTYAFEFLRNATQLLRLITGSTLFGRQDCANLQPPATCLVCRPSPRRQAAGMQSRTTSCTPCAGCMRPYTRILLTILANLALCLASYIPAPHPTTHTHISYTTSRRSHSDPWVRRPTTWQDSTCPQHACPNTLSAGFGDGPDWGVPRHPLAAIGTTALLQS